MDNLANWTIMDSLAAKKEAIIYSPVFELFLKQYISELMKKDKSFLHVPYLLNGFCNAIMLHNEEESIKYASIPIETIFVDNVDDDLEYLELMIKRKSKGYFNQLNEITKTAMRDSAFQSAIIAFFYLEGVWISTATPCKPRQFFNSNGTIAKNVKYFTFNIARVVVANGKLKASVDYVGSHNKRIRDVVRFTMPVSSDYEEGIFEDSLLTLPEVDYDGTSKVDLQKNPEEMNYDGTTVIQVQYKHNEKGFNWTGRINLVKCEDNDCGGSRPRKKFVLNKPFKIDVFFKSEKVLRVKVDNLPSNE